MFKNSQGKGLITHDYILFMTPSHPQHDHDQLLPVPSCINFSRLGRRASIAWVLQHLRLALRQRLCSWCCWTLCFQLKGQEMQSDAQFNYGSFIMLSDFMMFHQGFILAAIVLFPLVSLVVEADGCYCGGSVSPRLPPSHLGSNSVQDPSSRRRFCLSSLHRCFQNPS